MRTGGVGIKQREDEVEEKEEKYMRKERGVKRRLREVTERERKEKEDGRKVKSRKKEKREMEEITRIKKEYADL